MTDYICQHHFKDEHIKKYDAIKIGDITHLSFLKRKVLMHDALPTIQHQSEVQYELQQQIPKLVVQESTQNYLEQEPELENDFEKQQQLLPSAVGAQNLQMTSIYLGGQQKLDDIKIQQQAYAHIFEEQVQHKSIQSFDDLANSIKNSCILPENWSFSRKLHRINFIRIDPMRIQKMNEICLNDDMSISVCVFYAIALPFN